MCIRLVLGSSQTNTRNAIFCEKRQPWSISTLQSALLNLQLDLEVYRKTKEDQFDLYRKRKEDQFDVYRKTTEARLVASDQTLKTMHDRFDAFQKTMEDQLAAFNQALNTLKQNPVNGDVALFSKRQNVCGTSWIPYKDQKCIKIIKTANYNKESGVSICQSYTEVFNTDYSLLRIQNEEEQVFFSQLLFKENGIKENIWLEYNVQDNKTTYNETNLLYIPVDFNNWAKPNQGEKDGLCVRMLSGTAESEAGLWERVKCNELNIVVCERPQPVTMESLQAKHHQLEKLIRLLLKSPETTKKTCKVIRKIASGKPVQQSSTYGGGYEASKGNDGNANTMQHTALGDQYPWWRIDLLQPHTVDAVSVYSRPQIESRFHDVSIVISNTDINTAPRNTYFNPGKGSICADNIGTDYVVAPGWTEYSCKQDVVGRYVSLQIIADCKPGRPECNHPSDKNVKARQRILHVMEVEVSVVVSAEAC